MTLAKEISEEEKGKLQKIIMWMKDVSVEFPLCLEEHEAFLWEGKRNFN